MMHPNTLCKQCKRLVYPHMIENKGVCSTCYAPIRDKRIKNMRDAQAMTYSLYTEVKVRA